MTVIAYGTELGNDLMQDVRGLRLWHWVQMINRRNLAEGATMKYFKDLDNRFADFHLKQVQTLNMFFPVGDTAEQDHAKHPNMFKYMP